MIESIVGVITVTVPDGYWVINSLWFYLGVIGAMVGVGIVAMQLFLFKWVGGFMWMKAKKGFPVMLRWLHEGGIQVNVTKPSTTDLSFTPDNLPIIKTTGLASNRPNIQVSKSGIRWMPLYSLQAFTIPPEMPFSHEIWEDAYGFTAGAPEAELFNHYITTILPNKLKAQADPKEELNTIVADEQDKLAAITHESTAEKSPFLQNLTKGESLFVYGEITLKYVADAVKQARNINSDEDLEKLMKQHESEIQFIADPDHTPQSQLPIAFWSSTGLWCHCGGFSINWAKEKHWAWVNMRPDAMKRGMEKGANILFLQATAFTKYAPFFLLFVGAGVMMVMFAAAMKILGWM